MSPKSKQRKRPGTRLFWIGVLIAAVSWLVKSFALMNSISDGSPQEQAASLASGVALALAMTVPIAIGGLIALAGLIRNIASFIEPDK